MKRKMLFIAAGVLALGAGACQGRKGSLAQSCWNEAEKMNDFNTYIAENAADISMEELMQEADGAEEDLNLQFQAAALLCALEFQNSSVRKESKDTERISDNAMYQFDYPVSGEYAEKFLAQAKDAGKDFWEALTQEAFYPYDCFTPLFAAADQLDAQTLTALLTQAPEDDVCKDKFLSAAELWIEKNPQNIADIAEGLLKEGFYDDWDVSRWKQTYFYNSLEADHIQTDTLKGAFSYISYLRSDLLPMLKKEFGKKEFQTSGEYTGASYYNTNLTVAVEEKLNLKKAGKKNGSKNADKEITNKKITINGKKVAAFYQNTKAEKWEGSPAGLRMLGDFMLGLADDEFPASVEEADYYLVLTPKYERGSFYRDKAGNETKVRQVYSSTSIDLYNAKNGRFLRHLGNVSEQPENMIFEDLSVETLRYPEVTSADVLSYIYHNINDPDSYITLLDNTAGLDELQSGEPVVMGSWEITYKSCQTVKSFDEGILRYTAEDGRQYVRAEFAITNRSTQGDTFLPNVYHIGEDVVVQISDTSGEHVYDCVNAVNDSRCLNSTFLGAGESKEGELIFEVPDEMLEAGGLSIAISLGNQRVSYQLN